MLGLKPIQLLPARERVASALRNAILTRHFYLAGTLSDPCRFGGCCLCVLL